MRKSLIAIAAVAVLLPGGANAYDAKTTARMRELGTPQYPGGPTLGRCLAATDYVWQKEHADECLEISAKAIDVGLALVGGE